MLISETTLAPYRRENGYADKEMPFSGAHAVGMKRKIPDSLFTPTRMFFASQLHSDAFEKNAVAENLEIVLLLAFTERVPVLTAARDWAGLNHQCGGHATRHVRLIATQLKVALSQHAGLRRLARDRWHAKGGHFYQGAISAADIASYRGDLTKVGVSCDMPRSHLMESLYPIDATQANLDLLAEDAPRLDEIAGGGAAMLDRENLMLFVITTNSD